VSGQQPAESADNHRMRRIVAFSLTSFLALALLCCLGCSSGGNGGGTTNPPPVAGEAVLWADTLYSAAGNQAQIDIHGIIRTSLLSFHLPLRVSGSGITIDSVTYDQGILRYTPLVASDDISQSGAGVYIIRDYATNEFVEADSGKIATVHVSIEETVGGQIVTIDTSSTVGTLQLLEPDGEQINSSFGAGQMTVFEKSEVWVDSVTASPGEIAIVDVTSRLARPLQGMGLAFKVVGTGVSLDSILFGETMLSGDPLAESVEISESTSTIITAHVIRIYRKEDYIPVDSGSIARMYLKVDATASDQVIEIDTVTFTPSNFWFVDTLDVGSVPFFTPGAIEIQYGP